MKSWYLIVYIISITLLFWLHFILFEKFNFVKNDYLIAFLFLIPAIFVVGYIFLTIIKDDKRAYDNYLKHIIKETLHEINLPISTIYANINMLKRALKNEKDLKKLKRIDSSLKRLERLYKKLSYDIKKDIIKIEKEKVNLKDIILDRVAYFSSLKRNEFILNLEDLILEIDQIGLEQTIDNLIENAMKYSNKDKPIYIEIKNNILTIKDEGVGIDEANIPFIFQKYFQENSKFYGDGIGLAIVKKFCDDNNIVLHIDSKKGIGTIVKLLIKNDTIKV